jgi:hypothetical protein
LKKIQSKSKVTIPAQKDALSSVEHGANLESWGNRAEGKLLNENDSTLTFKQLLRAHFSSGDCPNRLV